MATNDFQPFAYGGAANVVSQSAYLALTTILQNGFSSGVAQSAQLNKVWRQSSIMAAVLAQFSSDYSGQNSTDDGTTATLETNLIAAIRSATKTGVILADTGVANAYTAVNVPPLVAGTWIDGVVQQVKIAHANTGASTYAPDGLTVIPIYGLGLQPLQGGELALNGTAILMRATIAGVNSGNPIAVLMECAGGAQQIAPATQPLHAVQFGQVAGIVGSVRDGSMFIPTASASATWSAKELVVETALGGLRYCIANASGTINLATTGAGGMDTGTVPTSGYVAIYGIYNPTTQTFNLLATNVTSSLAPEIYGGGHMPSGYTASALISVWLISGSQFVVGQQLDRKIWLPNSLVLNTSTQSGTYVSLAIGAVVPQNARTVWGTYNLGSSAITNVTAGIAGTSSGFGSIGIAGPIPAAGEAIASGFGELALGSAQTIYQFSQAGAGTISWQIGITGYSI